MNGFSFLDPGLPLYLDRAARLMARHYVYVLVMAVCIVLCAATIVIEQARLQHALALQTGYEQQLMVSKRELQQDRTVFQRMLDTIEVDKEVRRIASSGRADAGRMTQVADAIPEHAWLTSLTRIDDRFTIEGRAHDLAVVADVLRNLSRVSGLANPELKTAALADERGTSQIKYALEVQAR